MIYELLDGDTVINTIVADAEFMSANYPDGNYREVPQPEAPEPSQPRHISVGAFFDRFGAEKWSVLASTDPMVQAMVRDASVRKFIDLDRPDLLAGLQLVQSKGFDIDPQAIVSAPVRPDEQP